MSQFVDRMIRAAKLDVHMYEEVDADKSAMGVVVLSSFAGGIEFMQESGLMGRHSQLKADLADWTCETQSV